jgi:hypothetical protein
MEKESHTMRSQSSQDSSCEDKLEEKLLEFTTRFKVGIAISLYDRFEELGVLHDIFRHNFRGRYHLYVCSNHLDFSEKIKNLDLSFDGLAAGENIRWDRSDFTDPLVWRLGITCRSLNTIQTSCQLAMDDGCDYVMHVHCDAWPLSEIELLRLFEKLHSNSLALLTRGNLSYFREYQPVGTVDDHFFLFDAKKFKENRVFDFDPIDQLPHMITTHGILALNFMTKLSRSSYQVYSDWTDTERWPGSGLLTDPFRPLRPSSLDPVRGLVHVHVFDFPDFLGARLQSHLLSQWKLTRGPNIESYLKKFESRDVLAELNLWARGGKRNFSQRIIGRLKHLLNQLVSWFQSKTSRTAQKDPKAYFGQIYPNEVSRHYRSLVPSKMFCAREKMWFENDQTK